MTARHKGEVHLADAVYLKDRQTLCLYFVGALDNAMVIAYIKSLDPQAFLHGFLGGKHTQTAYDYNGYKIPASDN